MRKKQGLKDKPHLYGHELFYLHLVIRESFILLDFFIAHGTTTYKQQRKSLFTLKQNKPRNMFYSQFVSRAK